MRKFYLTYPVPTGGKYKNRTAACRKTSDESDIIMLCRIKRIQELLEELSFNYKKAVFDSEQEKENIICVRVG